MVPEHLVPVYWSGVDPATRVCTNITLDREMFDYALMNRVLNDTAVGILAKSE